MCRVGIGMHQADCYGLGATGRKLSGQPSNRLLIKRLQLLPARIHPPADGKGAPARNDQIGFDEIDLILAVAALIGDLENIAKPLARHRGHDSPAPLDQSIGGQCRAMDEAGDLRPVCTCRGQHMFGPRKRPKGRVFRSGRCFGGGKDMPLPINQDRIGEGTANIDSKA